MDKIFRWFETRIDPLKPSTGVHPLDAPTTSWRVLRSFFRETRLAILFMVLSTIAVTASELTVPWMIGHIVELVSAQPSPDFLATHWLDLVGFALLLVVVRPLATLIFSLVRGQTLVTNLGVLARWRTHEYVARHDLSFFQNDFVGRIANRVTQTGSAIRSLIQLVADQLLYAALFLTGTIIFLLMRHPIFALPVVLWIIAFALILRVFLPLSRKSARAVAEAGSVFTGRIVDGYSNHLTVRLFTGSGREDDLVRDALRDVVATGSQQQRYMTTLRLLMSLLNGALLAAGGLLGVLLWQRGQASAGDIAAVLALLTQIYVLSRVTIMNLGDLYDSIGTLEDTVRSLSKPRLVLDAPGAPPLEFRQGRIEFKDVVFSYGANPKRAIDDITLTIRPGEKIGLVGPSGAGKSTLVNLFLRLYDIQSGEIRIDDQDISTVTQDSLRGMIGVVTQDTSLLHRSIRENITYGRPDADEASMLAAAKAASAADFIPDLIDARGRTGYDAHVGERGVKLSGGQRQRIAIARVLLKNAPILVLDEATSALDSDIEAAIQASLDILMEGKTVIAIAHRLSTIARMDRLVVLDKGHIAEMGTHAELIAAGGIYAGLWSRQTGGFLDLNANEIRDEAAE